MQNEPEGMQKLRSFEYMNRLLVWQVMADFAMFMMKVVDFPGLFARCCALPPPPRSLLCPAKAAAAAATVAAALKHPRHQPCHLACLPSGCWLAHRLRLEC